MKSLMNIILVFWGSIVFQCKRINRIALTRYKTKVMKKKNPGILYVGSEVYWNNLNKIEIGAGSYLNGGCFITTDDSMIKIGENCLISYDVYLRTDSHVFNRTDVPIIEQGNKSADIVIGNNVWIGRGVHIMPGVCVGNNSIIGANAVVTKHIPENSIAVGIPARVIKNRE